ncbi:MAG: hypothetical protein PHT75_00345 [Bacilli bacterium]|nr:hypothetical protein [Bacilli bacterium]MDD3304570.1 hypothetical protein [Bacilli bacterium]MDD4053814.1 hypothetical protein [Bacilli bacterium]MDD4411319.1 hypothetical protein [Bacilli bacterium]
MNKSLKIISNILFLINTTILLSYYSNILNFSFIQTTLCSIIVVVLFIINLKQLKDKNDILNHNKYNIMFLLVNIIVLIIFLRDKLDPMIPFNSITDPTSNYYLVRGIFVDYNMTFILIMYSGLLIYNLLNKNKRKNIKK